MKFLNVKMVRGLIAMIALGFVATAAAPAYWRLQGYDAVLPRAGLVQEVPEQVAPPIDIGPIIALSPFGRRPDVQPTMPEQNSASLDLVLLGVILSGDASRSLALIESEGAEAKYRSGDTIADVAVLRTIATDYIDVAVGDETRRISFAGKEAEGRAANDAPTGMDKLAAMMTTGQGTTISERNDDAANFRPVTTQDYINMWRDRITANPAEVLDSIGLVPTENGYRVSENHDSGVSRAGLQAGDVVTTLNGEPVGDVDNDRLLYDQVAASGMARLEIERGGRTIVMSFPLR
jgi:general secretion pathway protein C